jgi:anti-anti-sigma factor
MLTHHTRSGADRRSVTIVLSGEIDLSNADELEAHLFRAAACATGDVRIDCEALEFIDSSGLRALAAAHDLLAEHGRTLAIAHPSPMFTRVLEISGLAPMFRLEP